MKTRMTIFASLLLAGFTFTSCDDNDDNYTPDEKIVNVLYEKYPNAQRVDWELQHDHYVADFYDNNIEKEAWFNTKGEWVMTESDILFENLPKAIQTAFGESEYKDWRVDDVDMLERVEMETMYVLLVKVIPVDCMRIVILPSFGVCIMAFFNRFVINIFANDSFM